MIRAVGAAAEQHRDFGARVADVIVNMSELVVRGLVPLRVRLDTHQAAHVVGEIHVPG